MRRSLKNGILRVVDRHMHYPKLEQAAVAGKRVLVRVGFDVPVRGQGRVGDPFRLIRTLPTIRWLRQHQAKIILLAHRGKPQGRRVHRLSLRPLVPVLTRLLHTRVRFSELAAGPLHRAVAALPQGSVLLVENLRFASGEEQGSQAFARRLAREGDLYVNDDFSTSHRDHASLTGLPKFLPASLGKNFQEELRMLDQLKSKPRHPFLAVLGGGKIRDKLGVLRQLLRFVDGVLLGGAAATTFLLAQGYPVGNSLYDRRVVADALRPLLRNKKIHLPVDLVVGKSATSKKGILVPATSIPNGYGAYDIGPQTIRAYRLLLAQAKTVFWAGPLGYNENPVFLNGTQRVAQGIPRHGVFAIAGGGDTIHAIHDAHATGHFSFLSTGGGAMLAYLSGEPLPALEALSS